MHAWFPCMHGFFPQGMLGVGLTLANPSTAVVLRDQTFKHEL